MLNYYTRIFITERTFHFNYDRFFFSSPATVRQRVFYFGTFFYFIFYFSLIWVQGNSTEITGSFSLTEAGFLGLSPVKKKKEKILNLYVR